MQNSIARHIVYFAGFIFSIPLALTSYINSSALERFFSPEKVGILYAVSALVTIFFLLELEKILTKLGNRKTTLFAGIGFLISLLLLAVSKSPLVSSMSFVFYFVSSNTIIATLDIFVEDLSKNKSVGTFRGMYIAVLSLAWVMSQTISGSIIEKSSYAGIYFFSALFMALFTFIFSTYFKKFKDPVYEKVAVIQTFKLFYRNANLMGVYLSNLILKFFFAWMIIYTPIYLHENLGLPWDSIGFIFSIMLLPFVLLPYPLGRLSDKIGEKKMLAVGFFISSASTAVIPLIATKEVLVWALILFMTRVGAATIETMSESYFFKVVDEKNADAISFFRNTTPMSFLIGPIVATIALYFVPEFSYLFFILSAVLLFGILLALRLREVK